MPLKLIPKYLLDRPLRNGLTLGSVVIAIFLLCSLRSLLIGLESGVAGAASNRLMVQSAVSLFVELPLAYQGKIEKVEGVERACKLQWFGGVYKEPSNFFAQFAVDHDRFFDTYPEVRLIKGRREDFERRRDGCIIGKELARKFGWGLGDSIPILGTIFPKTDGSAWDYEVVGIYESTASNVDDSTLWFRFDYLDETLANGGAQGPRGVGVYVLDVARGADLVAVSGRIDALFDAGPQRVQATTEAEFQRQFVSMLGSVPVFLTSIGGGVLFAIALAVLNALLMSGRQRTHDFGVLKALGFSDGAVLSLFLGEALLLCGLGGVLGIGLAKLSEPGLKRAVAGLFPNYVVLPETMIGGLVLALALGLFAGIIPAWRAARLQVTEALRAEV